MVRQQHAVEEAILAVDFFPAMFALSNIFPQNKHPAFWKWKVSGAYTSEEIPFVFSLYLLNHYFGKKWGYH